MEKQKRLLIPIGAFFPANTGGPSNTMYWHAIGLKHSNYEVKVVTTNKGIHSLDIVLNEWIRLDSIHCIYIKTKMHYFPFKFLVVSFIEIFKSDIVHLTSLFYPPNILIALLAILLKKRVVWSVRGVLNENALKNSNLFAKYIVLRVHNLLFRRYVNYHGTSNEEISQINDLLRPVLDPISLPNYFEIPEKIGNYPTKKYFLFIGRIARIKAIDYMIKGFSLSQDFISNTNIDIYIAGESESEDGYLEELKELITTFGLSERVKFLGKVVGIEKQKLYANAYFCCLLSHSENFGNVIVESLAQGTPVIVSKGCPWGMLDELNIGRWIENKPVKISETIDELINLNNHAYIAMRENAFQYCIKNFSIEENIEKWSLTYNKIFYN